LLPKIDEKVKILLILFFDRNLVGYEPRITINVEISERYFFKFDSTTLLKSQLVGIEETFSF